MHDLRSDTAPLPVVELAPIRLASSDPDEPFLLGAGSAARIGYCRLDLAALRRPNGDLLETAGVPVHAVITPCGVVRTARIGDVVVTEHVALIGDPLTTVHQWTADADAELVLAPGQHHALAAGDTITAVRGAAPYADIEKDFRSLAAGLTRALREGITLDTGDGTGTALAWAAARLWLHFRAASANTVTALAAPVTGHPEQLRLHLQRAVPDALPLLAARYAAWTGAVQDVRPSLSRLERLEESFEVAAADDIGRALRLTGLPELERTAADLGEHTFAADLRALGRRLRDEQAGRRLEPAATALLAALGAAGDPDPAPASGTETGDVAYHGWLTWAALQQGRLTHAGPAWRRLLGAADAPVRGAWPARFDTIDDDADATALFVLALAHGLLGLQPDAARHRLRIAPRLTALDRLSARSIPCGDARVTVNVAPDERQLAIHVSQDAGAIPITAVLEPLLDHPPGRCWIDGQPAELDPRPFGEGILVPVQLVLDDARTLVIERPDR